MSPDLPPISDHGFMRIIREQVALPKPMSQIAMDLGVEVDDLCEWIMKYKEPKPHKPVDNTKYGAAIAFDGRVIRDASDLAHEAARFKAWKRQHDGAKAARETA